MTKYFLIIFGITLLAITVALKRPYKDKHIPYDIDDPDQKIELPKVLHEISGLTVVGDNKLACIEDEDGVLFILDSKTGEIISNKRFGGSHDYEAVEYVNGVMYVLRSDGVLYEFTENTKTVTYKSKLDPDYDFEGLGYDASKNCLLIAAKENPEGKDDRYVFGFDLKTKEFIKGELYKIDLDDIRKKEVDKFAPSAIAVHPISKNRFILATSGKLLVVINKKGKVIAHKKLDQKLVKQPEGIAFMPDGTMYISNEGRNGRSNILRFNYETD